MTVIYCNINNNEMYKFLEAVYPLALVLGKQCTLLVNTEHFNFSETYAYNLPELKFCSKYIGQCSRNPYAMRPYLCSSTISLLRESSSLMAEKSAARLAALFWRQIAQFSSSQRSVTQGHCRLRIISDVMASPSFDNLRTIKCSE